MKILLASLFVFSSLLTTSLQANVCRVAENVRIETAADVSANQDLCEVVNLLVVYTEEDFVLPALRKARIINIEAEQVKTVSLPVLESAFSIYTQSDSLEALDLPSLKSTTQSLYLTGAKLRYVNVPEYVTATDVFVRNAPVLEFVFVDKLSSINRLVVESVPTLDATALARLQSSARSNLGWNEALEQTAAELRIFRQQHMQSWINRELPPTGHATRFRDYTAPVRDYCKQYVNHYDNLWLFYLWRARVVDGGWFF